MAGRVHAVRAIARTLGRLTELDPDVAGDPARASAAFAALASRTPAVTLQVSTAGRGRPVPAGYAQSVPGTMTLIVMMMTLIYGAVFLTIEKQAGMLRRQMSLPMTRTPIFLGKLAGRVLIAGLQVVILVVAGRFLFGVSWGESVVGLVLVLVSSALAVAGLSTLLGAGVRSPAQASSVGWMAAWSSAGSAVAGGRHRGHARLDANGRARLPHGLGHGGVPFADLVRQRRCRTCFCLAPCCSASRRCSRRWAPVTCASTDADRRIQRNLET